MTKQKCEGLNCKIRISCALYCTSNPEAQLIEPNRDLSGTCLSYQPIIAYSGVTYREQDFI